MVFCSKEDSLGLEGNKDCCFKVAKNIVGDPAFSDVTAVAKVEQLWNAGSKMRWKRNNETENSWRKIKRYSDSFVDRE